MDVTQLHLQLTTHAYNDHRQRTFFRYAFQMVFHMERPSGHRRESRSGRGSHITSSQVQNAFEELETI